MTAALCASFLDLATLTWQRLRDANQTGLRWSEETNTETLLLELRQRHPHHIKVASFTKAKEAKNGADWEWWIGGPGAWLGMRVQAKRIYAPRETFMRLQSYQARRQPRPQIDTLIGRARADRLNPVYCLYVHSRRWAFPSPACQFTSSVPAAPLGCLIGHAGAIRTIRSDALSMLRPVLVPWHLMFCVCAAATPGITVANHVFQLLVESILPTMDAPGVEAEGYPDDSRSIYEPVAKLPNYMSRLDELPLDGSGAVDALMLDAHAGERGIKGVVLINVGERRWSR